MTWKQEVVTAEWVMTVFGHRSILVSQHTVIPFPPNRFDIVTSRSHKRSHLRPGRNIISKPHCCLPSLKESLVMGDAC